MRGADGQPCPGLVMAWERRTDGWWAQVAYLVESDGVLVTQWLSAQFLTPAG